MGNQEQVLVRPLMGEPGRGVSWASDEEQGAGRATDSSLLGNQKQELVQPLTQKRWAVLRAGAGQQRLEQGIGEAQGQRRCPRRPHAISDSIAQLAW